MNLITTVSPTNFSYPYEGIYDSHYDEMMSIIYKPSSVKYLKNLCPSCGEQTFNYYSVENTIIGTVLRRRCISGKTSGCCF